MLTVARTTCCWLSVAARQSIAALVVLSLLTTVPTHAGAAGGHQQPAWLNQAVAHLQRSASDHFPSRDVSATLSALDSRLRLQDCAQPVFSAPSNLNSAGGRLSLKVQCSAPSSWTVYLPARIEITAEVAVLARAVRRGEFVGPADIRWQRQDITRTPDALGRSDPHSGLVSRRNIAAGTVLRANMLERPLAVRRGDRVTIQSARPGLLIESAGEALSDARAGDSVRVRNATSRRLIQAWAIADGLVTTSPPSATDPSAIGRQQSPDQAKVSGQVGR